MERKRIHTSRLIAEMNMTPFSVKAESLIAHAVAAGVDRESFLISSDSFFNRPFLQDIVSVKEPVVSAEAGRLRTTLSRPGFYDALPEGIFFQPGTNQLNKQPAVAEMAAMYRQNKKQEQELRKFFQPFEHAGFYQRLQLEEEECRLTQGLDSGILHNYLRAFWHIAPKMKEREAGIFLLLIPYACRITGNIDRMSEVLEILIPVRTKIELQSSAYCRLPKDAMQGLGEQVLGVDMVCGEYFLEPSPVYRVTVGPVQARQIYDYLEGGYVDLLLKTFTDFFVPAEAELVVDIELPMKKPKMNLSAGAEPVLGYTTCI